MGWVLSELDKLNLHKQVRATRWRRREEGGGDGDIILMCKATVDNLAEFKINLFHLGFTDSWKSPRC